MRCELQCRLPLRGCVDQMKKPPRSKPRTFTIVRCRLTNTYQRPSVGLHPRWPDTKAHRPSKPRRMSVGSLDSQMPPRGQLPSITNAERAGRHRRQGQARRPSRKPQAAQARRRNPSRPQGRDGSASSRRSSQTDPGISQKSRCDIPERSKSAMMVAHSDALRATGCRTRNSRAVQFTGHDINLRSVTNT